MKPSTLHRMLTLVALASVLATTGCQPEPPPQRLDALATPAASDATPPATAPLPEPESTAFNRVSIEPEGARKPARVPDVVFVATPRPVVEAMLDIAGVGPGDVLYDLGSGDGRIPITAARRWGTRGVGIDIDPQRIREARRAARQAGVTRQVEFIEGDLFKTDLSEATVVTLYLLPDLNLRLRPKLLQLPPGTRIVSHNYHMGDWVPQRQRILGDSVVYLWTVPETVPAHLQTAPPASPTPADPGD